MEEKLVQAYWRIAFLVLLVVFVSILYKALTTLPPLGDSSVYHIPIAYSFINGTIFHPMSIQYDLLYYPGASNAFLVPFILLNVDLNLFNIVGWLFLLLSSYYLARSYKLAKGTSLLISASIGTLLSVVRGMDTQSIDILLGSYIAFVIGILKRGEYKDRSFLLTGVLFGLIIGSKYSGPAYSLIIFLVFIKDWIKAVSIKRVVLFFLPIIILGGFWYIRNYLLTGNPFYPGHILMFSGNSDFHLQDWTPFKTVISSLSGIGLLLQSLFSEYLFVSLLLILVPLIVLKVRKNKEVMQLVVISLACFVVYLFLPSWPENMISDLRYNYGVFIPLIVAVFLLMKDSKHYQVLVWFTLANCIYILSYLGNHPKVYFISGVIFLLAYSIKRIRKAFLL